MSWKLRRKFLNVQQKIENNELEAAEILLSEILASDGDLVEALFHRVYVRQRLQRLDAALEDARKCIEIRPEHGIFYMACGEILLEQGSLIEAYTALKKACEMEKDNGRAFYFLGKTALLLGRKAEAGDYFETALQFERDFTLAQMMVEGIRPA